MSELESVFDTVRCVFSGEKVVLSFGDVVKLGSNGFVFDRDAVRKVAKDIDHEIGGYAASEELALQEKRTYRYIMMTNYGRAVLVEAMLRRYGQTDLYIVTPSNYNMFAPLALVAFDGHRTYIPTWTDCVDPTYSFCDLTV